MTDTQNADGLPRAIPARSKRKAMDWSLVLASQGIAAIINKAETGWALMVDPPDYERARALISQYQIENRGWQWRREVPGTGFVFHWGGLFWALALAGIYYWSTVRFPWLRNAGMVDSRAVLGGPRAFLRRACLPREIGGHGGQPALGVQVADRGTESQGDEEPGKQRDRIHIGHAGSPDRQFPADTPGPAAGAASTAATYGMFHTF